MTKYHAKPVVIDGIKFASLAEARRYTLLRDSAKLGLIHNLKLQPRFKLAESVKFEGEKRSKPALVYCADFQYEDLAGRVIVEDVKGMVTPVYRIKKHLMKAIHGIEIREIR